MWTGVVQEVHACGLGFGDTFLEGLEDRSEMFTVSFWKVLESMETIKMMKFPK